MAKKSKTLISPQIAEPTGPEGTFPPRVKTTIYLEPGLEQWLKAQLEARTWSSRTHAINWLIAWFRKTYGKKPFKIVWMRGT